MAGYQDSHRTGIGAWLRNFGSNFLNRGRDNASNYLPSNIRQDFSDRPIGTGMRVGGALLNPVGTAVKEVGRSASQAFADANDQGAYNNYMMDLFEGDPGYTPGGSSSTGYSPSQLSAALNNSMRAPSYSGPMSRNPSSTGDSSGGNQPLVNLNYGQNPQEYQSEGGGLPGLTGPNIYWNQSAANAGASIGQPAPGSYHSNTSNYLGATGNLAGNGRGQTVGYMTMNQLENMLSAGIGDGGPYRTATPRREVNSDRAAMRVAGFERQPGETVVQYRNRATEAGVI